MKKTNSRLVTGLVAGVGAVATVLAMSSPAHAATDYTPNGGPEVEFKGSNVSFTAVQAGQTLTCPQFDLHGDVTGPGVSRAFGDGAGVLDDLTASGCTNPLAGATTVDPTGTWGVAVTGAESGTVSPATLTSVTAYVEAAGCSFNVAGEVDGTFDDATQVFTPTSSRVKIDDVPQGFLCPILGVAQGQDIEIDGSWTNVPPSGSTNLTITNP
jgi:hypothetical protein